MAELLPVPYYHVVFTVPEEVASVAFQNKKVVYTILFRAASETLRTIAADRNTSERQIGFLAVLHTWRQTCCITRTCTASFPPADCPQTTASGYLQREILSSRSSPFPIVPREIPLLPQAGFRPGKTAVLGRSRTLADPQAFQSVPTQKPRTRMGRLRQTSLRRTRSSPRLPRPLYAPCRHFQSPLAGISRRQCHLPVERPQKTRPHPNHDSGSRRVHPPLPDSRSSPPLCQDPLLRLSGQSPSPQPAFTLSPTSQCSAARNRSPTPRLEIPPPSPDRRIPRYLSCLPPGPNASARSCYLSGNKDSPPPSLHRTGYIRHEILEYYQPIPDLVCAIKRRGVS